MVFSTDLVKYEMQHNLHNLHAPILFRKRGIPSEKEGGFQPSGNPGFKFWRMSFVLSHIILGISLDQKTESLKEKYPNNMWSDIIDNVNCEVF